MAAYNSISAQKNLSPRQMAGQFFMPAAFINDSEEAISAMERLIRDHHIGGICFFHSPASAATNFEGKKEPIYNAKSYDVLLQLIARYQAASATPLLISIDAEWGLAMRIENTPQYPYALTIGAMGNRPDLAEAVGFAIGTDCRKAGIHWNFAPVVDVNTNPLNPVIGFRSFGQHVARVTELAAAFALGLKNSGVMNCIKHFPGHGDTATDSHLGLPVLDKTLQELHASELLPFKTIIDGNIDAVMVGHLAVPQVTGGKLVPATISKEIIQGILKDKLGYEGLVVTDALNMHAITKNFQEKGRAELEAFQAGNDILCFPHSVKEAIDLIVAEIPEGEIEKRYRKVFDFKNESFNRAPNTNNKPIPHSELMESIASESITLFHGTVEKIAEARRRGFISMHIGKDEIYFEQSVQQEKNHTSFFWSDLNQDEFTDSANDTGNVLIALFPPKLRPKNKFGLADDVINFINELAQKHKIILYLFGNPYSLGYFDYTKMEAVIIAYQDFPEFQKNAARHFLGQLNAPGVLPVTLKAFADD